MQLSLQSSKRRKIDLSKRHNLIINEKLHMRENITYERFLELYNKYGESLEEYEKNEQEKETRFEEGCKKYEQLIAFCKDNGVKGVRNGMRKETILNKISNVGLVYQY